MDNKLLLTKCITLLYRESLLTELSDNSSELVRSVIENIKTEELSLGFSDTKTILEALKDTALTMCNNSSKDEYELSDLLQTLKFNLNSDDKLYETIKVSLEQEMTVPGLKRSIISTRKQITDYFKTQKVNDVLSNASYTFKYKRESIRDVKQFVSEIIAQLEPLQISTTASDPAVISDLDLGDDESMCKVFEDIEKANKGTNVYKTGWKALNRMLQGGFRPGLTSIGALQHKYKTGFSLTLFKQIALYNKPLTQDPDKKPLLLRISFEDDLELNLQFLYQSLKYDETRERVDMKNIDIKGMSAYVKERLQVNGFHIKLLRVDPGQWTYANICNKVIELEAQGYNVEVLMLDYLSKVPTTGCTNTGTTGSDICDLFSRIRNFVSPKRIVCITPHQLSTEAKQLIRNGMPEDQFVKHVAGLGYYQHTRALDQIVDLELFIHLFKHEKETYLSVMRGKHRIPTIVPESQLYFLLKFPKNMPIPDDREDEDQSIAKLSSLSANAPDELFTI